MDSIPTHNLVEKSGLCPIKGQPPSLIDLPSGCPFHPRCPYAKDRCVTEVPAFRIIEGTHGAACHFAGDPDFVRVCTVEVTS
jgi:oligopeptide transport system ATP-binding protein